MPVSIHYNILLQIGDGTTTVVLIAAELLKAAEQLGKQKIHPTSIINGYRVACKEAVRYMTVCILFISGIGIHIW